MLTDQESFWQLINESSHIAIIINQDRFGDSVGTGLALASALNNLGKKTDIFGSSTRLGANYTFLPNYQQIQDTIYHDNEYTISLNTGAAKATKVKYQPETGKLNFIIALDSGVITKADIQIVGAGYSYDLVVTIACPDLEAVGAIYKQHNSLFTQSIIINIDCNFANDNYGQLNLIDLKAAASAEIVYQLLIDHEPKLVTANIATCLLAGLISRTRNFKTNSVHSRSLTIASELIGCGADREQIVNQLYRQHSLKLMHLWGLILAKLVSVNNGQLIWSTLQQSDLDNSSTTIDDILALYEELLTALPDTLAITLFIIDDIQTKTLIYSVKNIDAFYLGQDYNPSGSKKLAEFILPDINSEQQQKAIENISKHLTKITAN